MLKVAVGVVGVALAAGVAAYFLVREDEAAATTPIRTTPEQSPHVSPPPIAQVGIAPPPAPPVTPEAKPGIASQAPTAIPGRREFDLMFRELPNAAEAHASFEKEPRDQAWAPAIEDRFNRAFSANVDLQSYSFPSSECRTTRCQIRLVAYGATNKPPTDWIQILNRGFFTSTDGQGPPPALVSYTIYNLDIDGAAVVMANFRFQPGESRTPAP